MGEEEGRRDGMEDKNYTQPRVSSRYAFHIPPFFPFIEEKWGTVGKKTVIISTPFFFTRLYFHSSSSSSSSANLKQFNLHVTEPFILSPSAPHPQNHALHILSPPSFFTSLTLEIVQDFCGRVAVW
jgi:hypothetical protein